MKWMIILFLGILFPCVSMGQTMNTSGPMNQWSLDLPENGIQIHLSGATANQTSPLSWTITAQNSQSPITGIARCGQNPVLGRIQPDEKEDVVQAFIGECATNHRANALFNRDADCAIAFNGFILSPASDSLFLLSGPASPSTGSIELIPHYYQTRHRIPVYQPIDKSIHRKPPSGWCSWYYYFQNIHEQDVVENAQWMARELKQYGAEYIQLDDGWQGKGTGSGDNRDFIVTDRRFPHGMRWLADHIHAVGLKAGLWTAPFGQSSDLLFKQNPEIFVRRPDGSSIGKNPDGGDHWVGRYIIDTSGKAGQDYMRKLFTMLAQDWGYDYFKIDGQADIPMFYTQYHDQLAAPPHEKRDAEIMKLNRIRNDGNYLYHHQPDCDGESYRAGLQAIRDAIGEQRFLLGCGGLPLIHGIGLMNGSRTGVDVVAKWNGVRVALNATKVGYYLHNIVWYSDPDVLCVREPLTYNEAQLWATLMGLSGQLLLVSDKMPDLPEDRVELLRRVFPAADVTPSDLYPFEKDPRVWDTKVHTDAGEWDVVGLFNYADTRETVSCALEEIGLPTSGKQYIAYDFWNKRYLGQLKEQTISSDLEPHSCAVYAVRESQPHPQVVSTSRHILQGAEDLHQVKWDPEKQVLSGTADVVAGDPYEIRIAIPENQQSMKVIHVDTGKTGNRLKKENDLVRLTLKSDKNETIRWSIAFIL